MAGARSSPTPSNHRRAVNTFDDCFDIVVGAEGGFTEDPADPGNWTGGSPGCGICRGTKFGISAAAYPNIDIAELTIQAARALYKRDYWDRLYADRLPPRLALLAFDAAVNNGIFRATTWLQKAAKVTPDGVIGPATLAAVASAAVQPEDLTGMCIEFLALRLAFMAELPTWTRFGLGWARRLCRLLYRSLTIAD